MNCPKPPQIFAATRSRWVVKLICCLAFLVFAAHGFGQDYGKARLIDEFDQTPCDNFLAYVDHLYSELNNHPNTTGYMVIIGGREYLTTKLNTELLFESAVGWRQFDKSRAKVVRGPETGPFQVKVWVVANGSNTPDFSETKWGLRMEPGSEPFLIRSDMSQICDPPPVVPMAKELLDANSDGALYVVIHGPTAGARKAELRNAQKMLAPLKTDRVRFFLRRSYTSYSDYYFGVGTVKRTDLKSYF